MTLSAFGELFRVSHAAVKKWEKTGHGPTNMNWTTEKDLRLYVYKGLSVSADAFMELYQALASPPEGAGEIIRVSLKKHGAAKEAKVMQEAL